MADFSDKAPARRGKIASLPANLRAELCRRMHDGQRGPQLLPWLNSEPAVLAVLDEHFGEEPITAQNLSEWRKGGYQDWLRRHEGVLERQQLAARSLQLAEATGATGVGLTVAAGNIMAAMEDFDYETLKTLFAGDPEKMLEACKTMAALETAKAKAMLAAAGSEAVKQRDRALDQRERLLDQRERQLVINEDAARRKMIDGFIDWAADEEARAIATSGEPREAIVSKLMSRIFGQRPEQSAGAGGV